MNGREHLPKGGAISTDGILTPDWLRFFEGLFRKPARESVVTLTGSPFDYAATKDGFLIVTGGTVSQLSYARGMNYAPTGYDLGVTQGQIVIKNGDVLSIVYTVAPTVAFYPD